MSFLLDTDTCSAHLKNFQRVSNRFYQYSGRLYVSAITLAELYVWALRAKVSAGRLPLLTELLKEVQVLAVDAAVARKFGEIRAWQLDNGIASPALDLLNGASALVYDLTVVTHNLADYDNIPGLRRADWLLP